VSQWWRDGRDRRQVAWAVGLLSVSPRCVITWCVITWRLQLV